MFSHCHLGRRLASFVKIMNQEDIIILIMIITMIIMMIILIIIIIIDGWPVLSRSWTRKTSASIRTTTPFKRYLVNLTSCECVCAISFIFQVCFGKSFKLNHPKPYAMSLISKLAGVSCARIIILSQDFHFVDPNLYSFAPILISFLPIHSMIR